MMQDISEYKYLWDGSDPDWVLVRERVDGDIGPGEPTHIFNARTRMMLAIENEVLAKFVLEQMLKARVRILDVIPSADFCP